MARCHFLCPVLLGGMADGTTVMSRPQRQLPDSFQWLVTEAGLLLAWLGPGITCADKEVRSSQNVQMAVICTRYNKARETAETARDGADAGGADRIASPT